MSTSLGKVLRPCGECSLYIWCKQHWYWPVVTIITRFANNSWPFPVQSAIILQKINRSENLLVFQQYMNSIAASRCRGCIHLYIYYGEGGNRYSASEERRVYHKANYKPQTLVLEYKPKLLSFTFVRSFKKCAEVENKLTRMMQYNCLQNFYVLLHVYTRPRTKQFPIYLRAVFSWQWEHSPIRPSPASGFTFILEW